MAGSALQMLEGKRSKHNSTKVCTQGVNAADARSATACGRRQGQVYLRSISIGSSGASPAAFETGRVRWAGCLGAVTRRLWTSGSASKKQEAK